MPCVPCRASRADGLASSQDRRSFQGLRQNGELKRVGFGITGGGAQDQRVLIVAGGDLQADWQAVAAQSARDTDRGMARKIELVGVGRPLQVRLAVRSHGSVEPDL